MATRKNYTAKIRFEIEPKSLKELEKILAKFKHTWDDKVFKATDQLGGRLDKLSAAVDLNRRSFESIMRNAAAGGTYAQKGTAGAASFDPDRFFNDLEKSMQGFSTAMRDAAQEISKLTINVKGNTSASGAEGEQRRADYAAMELAEGQRKVFMQGERHRFRDMEAAQDHRLKQERLMTRHMMSMFGGGLVSGSIGMMMKELGGGAGKRFTKSTETQEYLKTVEGQDTLAYARSDPNMRQPDFQGISKEWRDKGVSIGSVEEAGSARGRAKSWMGRRIQGAQEGDMSKMFGGKKGMAIAGGAIAGVGIMKKAISLGIESSPMMQQMLKLWKFGIMMIFRPIGDFFGFFLRPIFVMLLRKFIIPFYQEYLPMMQKMGHDLGEKVAGFLIAILEVLGGTKGQDRFVEVSATAGKGVDYEKFSEPLSLAMTESLIQNASYWEKMFIEMGKVPEWVKTSLPNNPELWAKWERVIDDVADASNTNPVTIFGLTPVTQAKTAWDTFWDNILGDIKGELPTTNTSTVSTNADLSSISGQTLSDFGITGADSGITPTNNQSSSNVVNYSPIYNWTVSANTSDELREEISNIAKDGDENTKDWFEQWIANLGVK